MDWKCSVCGKTFKRENQAHKCYSGGSPELAFPGRRAKWLPLYLELYALVSPRIQYDCDYPPSGGAIWRRRSSFASMHGESAGLYVNFFSSQRLNDPMVISVAPLSANRLLHVACLPDGGRLGQIAEYIVASYALTGQETNENIQ